MKSLLLAAVLLSATPVHAGGPVIIEDPEVPQAVVRKPDAVFLVALAGLAVAAIVLGGGSDTCTTETAPPAPEPRC